ncbi:3',5'-bisphosphate nucleotidase [Nannizzia gypsea CBS 118893]|uniref:3'(2'),5'-bisphosphate nucleotidase n=1 Tax=Arthroderma gypseum (strain ATCC MYA-4604 / CBS 118893) TaxID=535722 RepID=E4V4D8_ARTGP|nr:3',5'-bisphosphate nucleotidase [Nannizzia gypsea CBS 118893]EFR04862.1 3',5'-bisphosphate nucleotidase [Nannizzia gypsea CBS 118893]
MSSTPSYRQELRVAELAVQRASLLTQKVSQLKAKGTLSKDDTSPVTIGDFGAQALIIQAIKKNFPNDEVVAEEEASSLRENKALSSQIWELVKETRLNDTESDWLVGGQMASEEVFLDTLDSGKSAGGPKGRIWALDPIDGTKGFPPWRAVGAIGCPNLPVSDAALTPTVGQSGSEGIETGVLFGTIKGAGSTSRKLGDGALLPSKPISMRPVPNIAEACFCESVESGHSAQGDNAEVARLLGITNPSIRLDSQAKYCSIARGAGDIYLRLPTRPDYQEKIWDHAAGDLLVREAGGQVTDIHGKRLDFSIGRTLKENKGVVAAPASIHAQVIEAVTAMYGRQGNQGLDILHFPLFPFVFTSKQVLNDIQRI